MTVSVCMSLYNGEQYIEQQLRSILKQTRQPDQVILCDDGSTDHTGEIVERFLAEHKLSGKWCYSRNEVNLGYPACFYHAMSLCSGDIVFLSDQDDIWKKQKIEKMLAVFVMHPDAKVAACKFGLIDSDGRLIHSVMTPVRSRETSAIRPVTPEAVFYKCEWPGMVMAYRREWYQTWTQNSYGIPHDFLLCARAAEENGFLQLDEILAWHRRHENNAGGEEHRITRLLNKERKTKEIELYLKNLEQFETEHVLQTAQGKKALETKIKAMQGRYHALRSGKVGAVIQNAWRNRAETRLATFICDVGITILG